MSRLYLISALSLLVIGLLATACVTEDPDGDDAFPNTTDFNQADPDDPSTCPTIDHRDVVNNGTILDAPCYLVTARPTVDNGVLTINAGTILYFERDAGLEIEGDDAGLIVDGTDDEPVEMRGVQDDAGFWAGLMLTETINPENAIAHLHLSDAGSRNWGTRNRANRQGGLLIRDGSRVSVSDSTFRNNENAGIGIYSADDEVFIDSSLFENNPDYPIRLRTNHVGDLGPDNAFSDNGDAYVKINAERGSRLTRDSTWPTLELPYRVNDDFDIDADLLISPGTELHMDRDVGITVEEDGSLNANAEGADPIEFRGTIAESGYWRGLRFDESFSDNNKIGNAAIRHGGHEAWGTRRRDERHSNLHIEGFASLEFTDETEITDAGANGLTAREDDVSVSGCEHLVFQDIAGDNIVNSSGASACTD